MLLCGVYEYRGGVWCSVVLGVRQTERRYANAKGFGMRLYGVDDEVDGTSDKGVRGDE